MKSLHAVDGRASNGRSVEGGRQRPLEECWFTLAALEGDAAERDRVRDMVRQAGGRVFDAQRINLLPKGCSCAYAVCPLGFPPPRLTEALRQPDFKLGRAYSSSVNKECMHGIIHDMRALTIMKYVHVQCRKRDG